MAEYNWDWKKNLPPIATIFPQLGQPSVSPIVEGGMSYPTPEPVPMRPYTMPKANPPLGPGAAENITAPGVTGTALQPGLMAFGSSGPVGTPADPDKTFKEQLLAALNNKDLTGALALLAKSSGGGGKAPTANPMRMEGIRGMGGPKQNIHGPAQQAMSGALERMAGPDFDLTVPIQKKRRGRQDYYDIFKQGQ